MFTELRLIVKNNNDKTYIDDCYFTSPLKIGTPNYEKDRLLAVIMMASAGVLKGDCFDYYIECAQNAKMVLTEQSYTKLFDMGEGSAVKRVRINVGEKASLYYKQCAVIPFKNSCFESSTTISLSEKSEFAICDIIAAGRVGMGEAFLYKHYRSRIEVQLEGRSVWLDQCVLEPKRNKLQNLVYFGKYTHQGLFYYFGDKQKQIALIKYEPDTDNIEYAVTEAYRGIVVRVLACSAQEIEEVFGEIVELIKIG